MSALSTPTTAAKMPFVRIYPPILPVIVNLDIEETDSNAQVNKYHICCAIFFVLMARLHRSIHGK